ncbi:MAG: hypothetical protein KVP17_002424 [Porospora cf. gigantea B]|uniref:uncharacterized protein n=1 Tax=Porospora cf. gigantea B TaxID=2853592 RepID=UPI003571D698|nr:MAG: hypothetical protein KVP17_002424 [Porospora cf. gigantea B]
MTESTAPVETPTDEPPTYAKILEDSLEWLANPQQHGQKLLRKLYTLRRTVELPALLKMAEKYGPVEAIESLFLLELPEEGRGKVTADGGLCAYWVLLNTVIAITDRAIKRYDPLGIQKTDTQILELARPLADLLLTEGLRLATPETDAIIARGILHFFRVLELLGCPEMAKQRLMQAFQKGKLHSLPEVQASSANCILRLLLLTSSYEEATQFALLASFPSDSTNVASFARYLLTIGEIQALRMEYDDAIQKIKLALRKTHNRGAFLRKAIRLLIVLELLTGGQPSRTLFEDGSLSEYEALVLAVRVGDLQEFGKVVMLHEETFRRQGTLKLVLRLRHAVLRMGLKNIDKAYQKIPLTRVMQKLGLESVSEAEGVVCQGVADGIFNGTLNHETQILQCKSAANNVGAVGELTKRVQLVLQLHEEALVSVPYEVAEEEDPDQKTKQLEKERMENEERLLMVEESEMFDFEDFE